jgi:hypothetical protein
VASLQTLPSKIDRHFIARSVAFLSRFLLFIFATNFVEF